MKLFAFIMALLVIVQSCLPCNDDAVEMKAGNASILLTKNAPQQDQDHQDDACSPFCHCSCCAGFSITNSFITVTTQLPENKVGYSDRYIGALIKISLPVWQPPQLTA